MPMLSRRSGRALLNGDPDLVSLAVGNVRTPLHYGAMKGHKDAAVVLWAEQVVSLL